MVQIISPPLQQLHKLHTNTWRVAGQSCVTTYSMNVWQLFNGRKKVQSISTLGKPEARIFSPHTCCKKASECLCCRWLHNSGMPLNLKLFLSKLCKKLPTPRRNWLKKLTSLSIFSGRMNIERTLVWLLFLPKMHAKSFPIENNFPSIIRSFVFWEIQIAVQTYILKYIWQLNKKTFLEYSKKFRTLGFDLM